MRRRSQDQPSWQCEMRANRGCRKSTEEAKRAFGAFFDPMELREAQGSYLALDRRSVVVPGEQMNRRHRYGVQVIDVVVEHIHTGVSGNRGH